MQKKNNEGINNNKQLNCTVQYEYSTNSRKIRYTTKISSFSDQRIYVDCCRNVAVRTVYRPSQIWRSVTNNYLNLHTAKTKIVLALDFRKFTNKEMLKPK